MTVNPWANSQGKYTRNAAVTLTAVPASNWGFSRWEGVLSGSQNPTTVIMDADKRVTAVFNSIAEEGEGESPKEGEGEGEGEGGLVVRIVERNGVSGIRNM